MINIIKQNCNFQVKAKLLRDIYSPFTNEDKFILYFRLSVPLIMNIAKLVHEQNNRTRTILILKWIYYGTYFTVLFPSLKENSYVFMMN